MRKRYRGSFAAAALLLVGTTASFAGWLSGNVFRLGHQLGITLRLRKPVEIDRDRFRTLRLLESKNCKPAAP